ncbi:hypothetical protein [Roseovarius sp. EL26]|uniref:hypothetical protein n=1 Tax=Roseovarius sp. EL26 TaxID=2126672 RepID=UPI0013C45DD3|nr:hypothetical protein [Roseovarius sp. EL26]
MAQFQVIWRHSIKGRVALERAALITCKTMPWMCRCLDDTSGSEANDTTEVLT